MNKILSFDIGMKNLSFCIIEYCSDSFDIKDWGIINIFNEDANLICNGIKADGEKCTKNCTKFVTENDLKLGYCGTHIKKFPVEKIKSLEKINVNKIDILELYKCLIDSLENYKHRFMDVDEILIENQPALKNPKMKTIQVAIYTYFFIRCFTDKCSTRLNNIKQISASNKLKIYDGPPVESNAKNKYAKNKDLSIKYCEYFIKNNTQMLDYFKSEKKKDDLADSFLQGLYYIKLKQKSKKKI